MCEACMDKGPRDPFLPRETLESYLNGNKTQLDRTDLLLLIRYFEMGQNPDHIMED
jgi:hypothetical protein